MFLWHQHGFPVTNWSPLTLGLGDTRRLLKPASPSHQVHTPLLPVVLGLCPSPPCIACPLSVYAARATCPELFWALRVQQRTKQPKTPVLSKHPPLPREEANKYRIMTGSEEGSPKDRGGNEDQKGRWEGGGGARGAISTRWSRRTARRVLEGSRLACFARPSMSIPLPPPPPLPQDERPRPSTPGSPETTSVPETSTHSIVIHRITVLRSRKKKKSGAQGENSRSAQDPRRGPASDTSPCFAHVPQSPAFTAALRASWEGQGDHGTPNSGRCISGKFAV